MVTARSMGRSLRNVLHASLHIVLLYCLGSEVLAMEMCTKSVPVQQEPTKKVHVLRRVPASCSNWEKAWSWISKKDCGTKYRLDLVDVPSQKVVTYRVKKVCCEGDLKCKQAEADRLAEQGLDVSDERFLAIILGSTAAAVFVIILIVSISLCRKRRQCSGLCEERRHIYTNAEEGEESSELQDQKGCAVIEEEQLPEDTDNKVICESEYAEITDSGLPRYTDIFREDTDPFMRATAPPIAAYESRTPGRPNRVSSHGALPEESRTPGRPGRVSSHGPLPDESRTPGRPNRMSSRGALPEESRVNGVVHSTADVVRGAQDVVVPSPDSSKEYYNLSERGSQAGRSAREDTVLNLTKDDPAVVTATVNSPPSPTPSPSDPHPTPCEVESSSHLSPPKGRDAQYETLAQQGVKDGHEYQRLLSKGDETSVQDKDLGGSERSEVACVHREDPSLLSNHTEPPVEC